MRLSSNLLIILIGFTMFACNSSAQNERTIAFYNVENLFDTLDTENKVDEEYLPSAAKQWNSERYNTKLKHINKVLTRLNNPVIAGFCEVENAQVVKDIVSRGPMKKTHNVVHFESLDNRGIDNALIYDRTVLQLEDFGFIRFDMPVKSSPSRDIVWAKFKKDDENVLAMVNHWPSRRGGQIESEPKRLVASTAARAFIDSVQTADPSLKIIFMGDLNDYPDNITTQMISGTLKPMISEKSGEFGGTHSYRGEWHVLDHIMISSNFFKGKSIKIKKKSGKIHSYEFLKSTYKGNIVPFRTYGGKKYLGGYSDHFPVSVDVLID